MWFSFPPGCEAISIEQQQFNIEMLGDNNIGYFRAPDHFATKILALNGFAVANPPEGAPEDLPRTDPLRDGAIAELTGTTEAQKREIHDLREDLGAMNAKIIALTTEKVDLLTKLEIAEDEIAALKEKIDDAGIDPEVIVPLRKAK